MSIEQDLIIQIGQVLMRSAKSTTVNWDYAGYMFETSDGLSSSGEIFLYRRRTRLDFDLDFDDQDKIIESFKRLREVTRVDGDEYWIKCNVVLRSDGDLRMLFEFDNKARWTVTPANVDRAFDILVGEIYPEAVRAN